MEYFFIDDVFCGDLSDLMDTMDIQEEDLNDLDNKWSVDIELTTLEPMFKINAEYIAELFLQ